MNIPDDVRAQMDTEWEKLWPEIHKRIPGFDAETPEQQAQIKQQTKAQHLELSMRVAQEAAKAHKQACEDCAKLVDAFTRARASRLNGSMVLILQELAAGMRELGAVLDGEFGPEVQP